MLQKFVLGWVLIIGMVFYGFILGGVQFYRYLRAVACRNPTEACPTDTHTCDDHTEDA